MQRFGVVARAKHFDDAEAGANGHGAAKQPPDLLRFGVRGDVVILGQKAEQLVAHAATRPERLVAGLLQTLDHADGELALRHGRPGWKRYSCGSMTSPFRGWPVSLTHSSSTLRP